MARQRQCEEEYLRKIDFIFYNAGAIRDAVEMEKNKYERPVIFNQSGVSDPTAAVAIRNLTPVKSVFINGKLLRDPEKWLEVVDKTLSWCRRQGETYFELLKHRYNGEYFVKICAKLEIGVDSFYRMLEKIRNYAALQAASRQLITVD